MTTLLRVGNSEGERRCDAKCYDAVSSECDCCCHGMNHGKGLKVATEQTRELAESWLERTAQQQGRPVAELKAEIFGVPREQGALL